MPGETPLRSGLDIESAGFMRTEGTEFDGVVTAVDAPDSNSRDDVEDEEDGKVLETGTDRDMVEAAGSSYDDSMFSEARSFCRAGDDERRPFSGLLRWECLVLLKIEKRDLKLPFLFIGSAGAKFLAPFFPAPAMYSVEDWCIVFFQAVLMHRRLIGNTAGYG